MPRLIAFLRAINVGGHTVTMAQLRKEFEALGLRRWRRSSPAATSSSRRASTDTGALVKRIEARLHASLGYEVATFVRTDAELATIACYRPFPAAAIDKAGAFCVGFLDAPLDAAGARALMAFKTDSR